MFCGVVNIPQESTLSWDFGADFVSTGIKCKARSPQNEPMTVTPRTVLPPDVNVALPSEVTEHAGYITVIIQHNKYVFCNRRIAN